MALEFEDGKEEVTGSALLVKVMERFSEMEPKSVVVAFTTQEGDVVLMSNTRRVEIIGMLEICKANVLGMYEDSNRDEDEEEEDEEPR